VEDEGNSVGGGSIRKDKKTVCKGAPKNKHVYREHRRIFPLAALMVPDGRFP
jgi:hypothetical protein